MNKPKVADLALHVAIDAINIRQGGGVTHLTQLLAAVDPLAEGVARVTVWTCAATARELQARPWLVVRTPAWAEAAWPLRIFGQQWRLGKEMREAGCDVVFSPGGTLPSDAPAVSVTMSQNMLPFEPDEAIRFGRWSWMRLKMWLLRQSQGRSFKKADGLIFLTQYACEGVSRWLGRGQGMQVVIPHGVEPRFAVDPKTQRHPEEYTFDQPFTFLYVSILMPYKHQIEVAKAASLLRHTGCPVRVKFVGAAWGRYGQEFRETLRQLDPGEEFLISQGSVPFSTLHSEYQDADAFVFASSCENLPNILIEAMAAGLPIACAKSGPMHEVLGNAGVYFDPLQPQDIAEAMRTLVNSADLRGRLAIQAQDLSRAYSWQRCARETFEFIAAVATSNRT